MENKLVPLMYTYTETVTKIVTFSDIYGSIAPSTLIPPRYRAVDFRPPLTGELFVPKEELRFGPSVGVACADFKDRSCVRLIVEKIPEPLKFSPKIFGPVAARRYGPEDITLPNRSNLIGFSTVRPHIDAHYIDPKTHDVISGWDHPEFTNRVIWVEKQAL